MPVFNITPIQTILVGGEGDAIIVAAVFMTGTKSHNVSKIPHLFLVIIVGSVPAVKLYFPGFLPG